MIVWIVYNLYPPNRSADPKGPSFALDLLGLHSFPLPFACACIPFPPPSVFIRIHEEGNPHYTFFVSWRRRRLTFRIRMSSAERGGKGHRRRRIR
jgi:hypothetical protein